MGDNPEFIGLIAAMILGAVLFALWDNTQFKIREGQPFTGFTDLVEFALIWGVILPCMATSKLARWTWQQVRDIVTLGPVEFMRSKLLDFVDYMDPAGAAEAKAEEESRQVTGHERR